MKILTQEILAKRKIVVVFLLAILLPSLVVGYLSLSTFAKRRETVKQILESNLWISGEAALKSIEGVLLEYENEALRPDHFRRLIQSNEMSQGPSNQSLYPKNIRGDLFLLDENYQIIIPKTEREQASILSLDKNAQDSEFIDAFKRAEYLEFSQKDYSRAADAYQKCASVAPSKNHKALALEGQGRCLFSSKKFDEAQNIYKELSTKYGQLQNKAGHPYGVSASFQMYEIERHQKKEKRSLEILLDLYEKIRNGNWLVNLPVYDFFISEIESILDEECRGGKFPQIQESHKAFQKQPSSYLESLLFTDFLKREAVPRIKEKIALTRMSDEAYRDRFPVIQNDELYFISYSVLPRFQSKKTYYGGFCWDLDSLKKRVFPKVLEDLREETGLHLRIVDEDGKNILTGKEQSIPKDSLRLSYRQFPFPWKLLISQPAFNELAQTARRENFFYGTLLAFIVALMLLGAFLIVRDISRESETTRLKTEFVNNISHELKTPLTLIRLYGETLQLKEKLSNEEKKECYEIITKESERLSHLINNVLDFSRIEMGRKEFDFKKGNLAQVVRDTLESYRYHLEKKGFVIHEEIASDLPEMIFDGESIASVFINLLSNAMKFSKETKEVTVKLYRDNGNAVLQVKDKGIGISPKEISRIFKRFYRSKDEIVSETRGSGLGLTLVKHITDAHKGKIKVQSEPGKGSTFSIILPISGANQG